MAGVIPTPNDEPPQLCGPRRFCNSSNRPQGQPHVYYDVSNGVNPT
jgi:hypothetical protein